jgi:hypothetical protein
MRHEAALKRLDELDAGQDYGFALRMHLARCQSCSASAERVRSALSAYRAAEEAGEDRIEDRVMAALRLMPPPRQDFALRDWLLPGAIIALSMFLLPFLGKDLALFESLFGQGYELSLALVLGIAFTAYCALFIATHLTELQAYLEKRGLMPR